MPLKILNDLVEVGNRLEELGVPKAKLIEVIEAMVSARADCTPNDPPGSRGWSSYRMGTRRLREEFLIEVGWEKDDTDQIASIVNKKLGIRIVVANTDDATGIEDTERFPQNRSKKGAATDRVVQGNQLSFMDALDESLKVIVAFKSVGETARPIITWYVCVYNEGDEVRAEFSCPVGLDGGFFTNFVERIFIIGPDGGDGAPVRRRPGGDGGDGSEFDIPVTRKK
jgi:hypothetical protein